MAPKLAGHTRPKGRSQLSYKIGRLITELEGGRVIAPPHCYRNVPLAVMQESVTMCRQRVAFIGCNISTYSYAQSLTG